jgi:hypothetical protein
MVVRVVNILKANNKVATGELIDSIDYIIGEKGGEYTIKLLAEFYWVYVEYGRRPGSMPPPDAILEWIKAKRINRGDRTDESLAWAIAKSIQRRGIKGIFFLEKAVKEIEEKWGPELEKNLGDKWEEEIVRIFKNNFRAKVT